MSNEGVLFLFNKSANRGNSSEKLDWLQQRIQADSLRAKIVIPPNVEQLEERVKSAWDEGYSRLIVCGGDGTLNRVISKGLEHPYTYGIIPMGSGNDFCKSVGVPNNLEKAYRIATSNVIKPTDILSFDGDAKGYCINTLGYGFDGWANYYALRTKFSRGKTAYTIGAIKAIQKFKGAEMSWSCDDSEGKENLLLFTFCNGKIEGGDFPVAPKADVSDGLMDVLMISPLPTISLLFNLQRFKFGKAEHLSNISRKQCRTAVLNSEVEAALHCDGEQLGTHIKNLKVQVLPGKISFLVSNEI